MLRKNFPQRREKRQIEAKARQEEYSKLSIEQKIAALPKTGAKRQRELLK